MRRFLWGVLVVCVAAVVAVITLTPRVAAQGRGGVTAARGVGAWIGVSVRDLQGDEATKARLSSGGAFVDGVAPDSPAARSGFKIGDIVIDFDGERVRSALHFTRLVRETVPGRAVKVTLLRDGNRQAIEVTADEGQLRIPIPDISRDVERGLRDLPRNFSFDFDFDGFPNGMYFTRGRLGATLMPMTDQLSDYFGVKQGALVTTVMPDSPSARAGLKAGDVVTAVNGKSVESAGDVTRALRDVPAGGKVELRVMRDRKELTLTATLPERDRERPRRGDRIPV